MIVLRDYQQHAIDELIDNIRTGKTRLLLQAATGAGKTIIAAEIIRRALAKGKHSLFIAHRKEIITQTSDKLDGFGIDHGVIMSKHKRFKPHESIQVASIQTLSRRGHPNADLVIIDECHLSLSKTYKAIISKYPKAIIIGLTATPVRLDGKGLGEIYECLVEVVPMSQLIADGHLVKPRVFTPNAPDLAKVKTVKGDYDLEQVAEIMNNSTITGDIVKNWQDKATGRKTICFASSVAHSKNIVEQFISDGFDARHLDATTPAKVRDKTLQAWRDGEFLILSNMGLFVEGLDVPAASCCILARPTKSVTIYLQAAGRVMRPHETKQDCIILDHAGLTREHGLIQEPRAWSLIGKPERDKAARLVKPHCCDECFFVYSKAEFPDGCPECGYIKPEPEKAASTAELTEITDDIEAEMMAKAEEKRARAVRIAEEKAAQTIDDFIALGAKRGYKRGWAYVKMKERNDLNELIEIARENGYRNPTAWAWHTLKDQQANSNHA